MNILQIEDDIKSLPDTNLMEAMQTGSYPQYLVLSELKRRKDMRDDHAGRMASYDKNNTVADKIMGEASMGMMNQGLGAMAPQNMQAMQGMPQNTPQMPVGNQGIGQMMPSNMQGMKDGRKVYPNAGLAALAEEAPEAVEKMGYSGGGIVEMAPGRSVPYESPFGYSDLNPQGVGQFYDFYKTRMQPTQAELDYQQMMRGYFDPEEQKRRNKAQQGLNLVRAGLAVGTSATPEQLSKNLDPVISSAAKSIDARDKEGLMQAKFEADIAKQNRERDTNIAELAYKSQYTQAMIDQAGSRESNLTMTARGLAVDMPEVYAVKLDAKGDDVLDPKTGRAVIGNKPNQRAYDAAKEGLAYSAVTSKGIAEESDLRQKLTVHMENYPDSQGHFDAKVALRAQPGNANMSDDEANIIVEERERIRVAKILGIALASGGQVPSLQMGGQIPALGEDPPMLDMSSRF